MKKKKILINKKIIMMNNPIIKIQMMKSPNGKNLQRKRRKAQRK